MRNTGRLVTRRPILTSIRRAPKHRSETLELGQPQLRLISSYAHSSHISAAAARLSGLFPPSCRKRKMCLSYIRPTNARNFDFVLYTTLVPEPPLGRRQSDVQDIATDYPAGATKLSLLSFPCRAWIADSVGGKGTLREVQTRG